MPLLGSKFRVLTVGFSKIVWPLRLELLRFILAHVYTCHRTDRTVAIAAIARLPRSPRSHKLNFQMILCHSKDAATALFLKSNRSWSPSSRYLRLKFFKSDSYLELWARLKGWRNSQKCASFLAGSLQGPVGDRDPTVIPAWVPSPLGTQAVNWARWALDRKQIGSFFSALALPRKYF